MIWRPPRDAPGSAERPRKLTGSQARKPAVGTVIYCIVGALVVVGALVIHRFSGPGFFWCIAIAAFAVFLNGLILTIEDDLPGGFNNPTPVGRPDSAGQTVVSAFEEKRLR